MLTVPKRNTASNALRDRSYDGIRAALAFDEVFDIARPRANVADARVASLREHTPAKQEGGRLKLESAIRSWRRGNGAVARRCASRSVALVLVAAVELATAAPRLLDLHGTGSHSAIVRNDDGAWRAYGGDSLATTVPLAMTTKAKWLFAAAGDFNGDGRDDVLLRRTDGPWAYYPMDGGTVADTGRGWTNMTRSLDWRPVGVGDFNDDGRDDVLLRRADGAWRYYAMDGRRVVAKESGPADLPESLDLRIAGVGDFDGDGRDDVLLRHVDGPWWLYPMDGRQIVHERATRLRLAGDVAWRYVSAGDFDANGRDDVLLRHTSGRWRWQTGAGDTAASHASAMPRDWRWRVAAVGDLDRDGSDDVLLRHVDGRWRTYTALGGAATAATPGMPRSLAWRTAAPPVYIPDTALRAAVLSALGLSDGSPITRRALSRLEVLEADGAGVSDITGLGLATGLRELSLDATLPDRRHEIPIAVIGDVGELASLVQLGRLSLANQGLTDITPLSNLTVLTDLDLARNRIADISTLRNLRKLEGLELSFNDVVDVFALEVLTELRELKLRSNHVTDIGPLSSLHQLGYLWLWGNQISDVTPLAHLSHLRDLLLSRNRIEDVSPLTPLTNLTRLALARNRITDLTPLATLRNLKVLFLSENRVADVTPLAELTDLWLLGLSSNEIQDVSALRGLTNMERLWLGNNAIVDVSPLSGMLSLTRLFLESNNIEDISPLSGLGELLELDLSSNDLVIVAALEFLTELEKLDLSYNRITDIAPLAANAGLGDGDSIDLRGNPLSATSLEEAVAVLVDRGAQVETPVRWDHDFLHDDVIVVLPVDEEVASETVYTGLPLREYATEFYTHFEDQFDFLMFFSNLDDIRDHEAAPYYGVYQSVRNDVEGTGRRKHYDNRYGSRERLKGVIHFPYNRALMYGPSLHEILHAWANFAVPTAVGSHWGFSSADGQLGGFDLADLRELGEGRYTAGRFGTFANGGNRPAYSPIELYFAGYLPPEEVPDLWVAQDGHWEIGEDGKPIRAEDDHPVFRSQDERTYTIDEIVALHGERLPAMADAQWHYRVAVVLLTDERHPATEEQLDLLSEHAAWFSLRASDDSRLHNFFEATRGRGSITLDGLATARKAVIGTPTGLPASYGQVPPAHASLVDGTCVTVDLSGEHVAVPAITSGDLLIHNN